MNFLNRFNRIKSFVDLPPNIIETTFIRNIFHILIPIFIVIFLVIAYGIFPLTFNIDANYYKLPNVVNIHIVLSVLIIMWVANKKGKTDFVIPFLPLLFAIIACTRLFNDHIMEHTPFIPFYAGSIAILMAGTFLSLKKAISFIILFLTVFISLSHFVEMTFVDFTLRCALIYVLSAMMLAFSYARKGIFQALEKQSSELIEMSNIQILAELSSGIAHEINNPLFIIQSLAGRIKKKMNQGRGTEEEYIKDLELIDNTVSRIAKITESLLDIAQKKDGKNLELVSLIKIIKDSVSIFEEKLKVKNIKLDLSEINEKIELECVPVQIFQIFVNLINNAMDAVESTDERWININVSEDKKNIIVNFSDSGQGITGQVKENIFKPFFTTKDSGKGTGLGLSICSRIAHSHNGSFNILEDTANTTFQLILPRTR